MNEKRPPPTIATAVCSTIMGLFALAGCFFMLKSDGPDFLVITFILLNMGLIALAVLQWVLYFRAYVNFRIDELRREQQGIASPPPRAAAPQNDTVGTALQSRNHADA